MKTLNFLLVLAFCFMAISRVSATYYIVKTFENYGSNDGTGEEGQLTEIGQKRVECFAGLVASNKINAPQIILYKKEGKNKEGQTKINSREFTAKAIADKLGITPQEISGDDSQLSTLKSTVLQENGYENVLFVWSDKDKATKLANALGATNAPESFKKSHYGTIWAIDGDKLNEIKMGCEDNGFAGVKDVVNGSQTIRVAFMSVFVSVMATLYFLF